MSPPILKVQNLVSGYPNFSLQQISFQMKTGEFLGIIGPNGSGKSTLLKTLTKIIEPKQGEIFLEGISTRKISYKDMAKIMAVVTQNPEVGQLKVEEYILLGRIPHFERFQFMETSADMAAANKSMDLTRIHHLRDKTMSEISGGEQKLVSIARALCQEPRLLVLDEPTSFLDISNQMGIMDLLRKMNQNTGLSVIAVLHDLNLASEYCDRVIMLNEGRVYKMGTPGDIFTYQIIEDIYKTVVLVKENPITKRPYIFPIPQKSYIKNKK